ncbi:MAG TPA: cytochrome c biogenesis heme-transporting ATPase CcmA [Burkholderiaceae bacterium]|nr:cytochrome c biogenesis heme-transporting ATPase CcmA [Burkholderiaceae bacterium]
MTPILQLESVACRRGDRLLFAGLSETLAAGELLWLRGSNGRGKTSLLRLVAGLAVPEEGRILWRGEPVRRSAAYARELLYVAHANALKDDLTATESLAFLARVQGRDFSGGALRRALDRLGLGSRARASVRTLSQGQRRRVALARLALEPAAALWVLDEPFDALDLASTTTLHELLDTHRAAGGGVLLTSHHLPLSTSPNAHVPAPRVLDLDTLRAA